MGFKVSEHARRDPSDSIDEKVIGFIAPIVMRFGFLQVTKWIVEYCSWEGGKLNLKLRSREGGSR